MTRTPLVLTMATSTAALIGCASKGYVHQQTTPLVNKVNELDEMTSQNAKDIKDVDARAQAGIQQADANAAAAGQQANQAQTQANSAVQKVDTLQTTVANLDNYRAVSEASVEFAVNKDHLTNDAKAELDKLATDAPNVKNYIFVVKGHTDSTGPKSHNNLLSMKRANAVVQYLAVQHNVPPYKLYVVGLGEHDPVDSNKTRAGRAKNRRADVSLMTNAEGATTASNQ